MLVTASHCIYMEQLLLKSRLGLPIPSGLRARDHSRRTRILSHEVPVGPTQVLCGAVRPFLRLLYLRCGPRLLVHCTLGLSPLLPLPQLLILVPTQDTALSAPGALHVLVLPAF